MVPPYPCDDGRIWPKPGVTPDCYLVSVEDRRVPGCCLRCELDSDVTLLYDNIMEVIRVGKLVRKQTYITPAQDDALKRIAGRGSRTEADVIREALEQYLRTQEGPRRDPLIDIVGIASGGPRDGAERHDRDIYDRA